MPCGVLAPALALGACAGRLYGELIVVRLGCPPPHRARRRGGAGSEEGGGGVHIYRDCAATRAHWMCTLVRRPKGLADVEEPCLGRAPRAADQKRSHDSLALFLGHGWRSLAYY